MYIRPKGVNQNTLLRDTEATQNFDEMKSIRCDQGRAT